MIQRYLCRYFHCLGNVLIFLVFIYSFCLTPSVIREFIFPKHLDNNTEARDAAADSEAEYLGILEELRSER